MCVKVMLVLSSTKAESSIILSTKSSDLAFRRPKTPQLFNVEATISRMTFRCPGVKFSEEDVNVEEEGVVSWNRRGFITPAPEDNLLSPALFMFRKNNLIY